MTAAVEQPKRPVCNIVVTAEDLDHRRILVALRYDSSDPYAVTVVFPGRIWQFGRDLLRDGLRDEAGEMDVRIEPDPAGSSVLVHLQPPGQFATFAFDMEEIGDWVDAIYRMVPEGRESDFLDLDALMDDLTKGPR